MKTFVIFGVISSCLVLASGQRFPSLSGIANAIVINIEDFDAVSALYSGEGNLVAKESILGAIATAFVAKFKDGAFLKGKSIQDIITDFKNNAREVLSLPIDPLMQRGFNEVMGLSKPEFQALLGTRPENRTVSSVGSSASRKRRQAAADLPKSVDWRTKGAVTPVKNQAKCGSCWAFAAVGALEGRLGVKSGQAPVLSEQNMIDCAKNVNGSKCCQGCGGGWMTDGYTYVNLNEGIDSESGYPYEAKDATCRYNTESNSGNVLGFEYTDQDDELDLMRAVAQGPVAVAVDANNWSSYKSGIFRCKLPIIGFLTPLKINHGVTVVGYGEELLGKYWLVKNSWGATWGDKGYIKIARQDGNQCGIASQANYPHV